MAQKTPSTVETYNFFVTCDFLSFRAHPLIWMCCMEKVGWLFCCMKDGICSKLFYWPIFHLAVRIRSFNSTTITEWLNSCTTKIVQCAPRLIYVKSYNLIMILTCGTTAQNVQCERKVRICADFPACWYLLIFLISMPIFYIFNQGALACGNPPGFLYHFGRTMLESSYLELMIREWPNADM